MIFQAFCRRFFGRPHMLRRIIVLLFSVMCMGMCVAVFDLVGMGTDPCSSLNLGISRTLRYPLGICQLICNLLLMTYILIFDRREIGLGTLANMVVVGYTADFYVFCASDRLSNSVPGI